MRHVFCCLRVVSSDLAVVGAVGAVRRRAWDAFEVAVVSRA
jgi:hypothetical protein